MSRLVTLAQLRADVQNQADIAGASSRHVASLLTRMVNQSIQRFRGQLSDAGCQHYLTNTSGMLSAGATSPYPFYALNLSGASPAIVRTYAVDIDVSGRTKTLIHVPFNTRDKFCGPLVTGEPIAWAHYQTEKVAIMPAPGQEYNYVVWHLPVLPDLAADSDTFDGVAGWEDYIVWDVVARITVRDKSSAYHMANEQKHELMRDILKSATRVTNAGGGVVGRDSFGEKLRLMGGPSRLLPPRT